MANITKRMLLAVVATVAFAAPAAAEEQGDDWLGAVGDFVRAGLGPARTMADIRREEDRAREADAEPAAKPEPMSAAPKVAMPQPPHEPAVVPAPAAIAPVVATPQPESHSIVKPAPAPVVEARPQPKPAPAPVIAAPPQPRPAAKPAPVVVHAPPPEPPANRIAATATIDQARKLGGATETYGLGAEKTQRN